MLSGAAVWDILFQNSRNLIHDPPHQLTVGSKPKGHFSAVCPSGSIYNSSVSVSSTIKMVASLPLRVDMKASGDKLGARSG